MVADLARLITHATANGRHAVAPLPKAAEGNSKGRPETGKFAAAIIKDPSQSSGLRFPFEFVMLVSR